MLEQPYKTMRTTADAGRRNLADLGATVLLALLLSVVNAVFVSIAAIRAGTVQHWICGLLILAVPVGFGLTGHTRLWFAFALALVGLVLWRDVARAD